MTKIYYNMMPMILPCNLQKGQILEHRGVEKVVSKIIKPNNGGVTTYVYFEGDKGYSEYSNSFECEVLGCMEEDENLEEDETQMVNFKNRRIALECAAIYFAHKSYVESSAILEYAEDFEQWLER